VARAGAVQRACGHPSHPGPVTPGFQGTGSRSLPCLRPLYSSVANLSQAERGGECHVKAAQRFPVASCPPGPLPGAKVRLYVLQYVLYRPGPTDSSTGQPPAL